MEDSSYEITDYSKVFLHVAYYFYDEILPQYMYFKFDILKALAVAKLSGTVIHKFRQLSQMLFFYLHVV